MKIQKGDAGYIQKRKKQVILKVVLEFGIVIALLILGITQTGSRANVLTIVAVLGCLPASKALIELIMLLPHKSIGEEMAAEIAGKSKELTVSYDMIITNEKHAMPVDAAVVLDNTVCGYTSHAKTNAEEVGNHIRQIFEDNKFQKITVKIFKDYKAFLARVEGLENMAEVSRPDTKKKEEALKRLMLNISL